MFLPPPPPPLHPHPLKLQSATSLRPQLLPPTPTHSIFLSLNLPSPPPPPTHTHTPQFWFLENPWVVIVYQTVYLVLPSFTCVTYGVPCLGHSQSPNPSVGCYSALLSLQSPLWLSGSLGSRNAFSTFTCICRRRGTRDHQLPQLQPQSIQDQ